MALNVLTFDPSSLEPRPDSSNRLRQRQAPDRPPAGNEPRGTSGLAQHRRPRPRDPRRAEDVSGEDQEAVPDFHRRHAGQL